MNTSKKELADDQFHLVTQQAFLYESKIDIKLFGDFV